MGRTAHGALRRLPLAADTVFFLSLGAGLVAGLNSQGKASLPLLIPNLPELAGLRLHFAGVAFGTGGISSVTNRAYLDVR